jgi:hypothetical protein
MGREGGDGCRLNEQRVVAATQASGGHGCTHRQNERMNMLLCDASSAGRTACSRRFWKTSRVLREARRASVNLHLRYQRRGTAKSRPALSSRQEMQDRIIKHIIIILSIGWPKLHPALQLPRDFPISTVSPVSAGLVGSQGYAVQCELTWTIASLTGGLANRGYKSSQCPYSH